MGVRLFNNNHTLIALILGLAIFIIGLFRPYHPFLSILNPSRYNPTQPSHHQYIIEVAGAVKEPGIYTFDKPPTTYKAIQRAGGQINNSHLSFNPPNNTLDTGTRIELQESTQGYAQVITTPLDSNKKFVLGIPIDLNQAGVEDLTMIPGIGNSLAMSIVEFRKSHGPFKTINDLRLVKGVGTKKVESFRSYLVPIQK